MKTELELGYDNLRDSHWLGEVVDNKDPLNNGRCRVRVFGKFDLLETDTIPWASNGNRNTIGHHAPPAIGNIVAITFDNGNIYAPVYSFEVNQNKDLKSEILEQVEKPEEVISLIYDVAKNFRFYKSEEDGLIITTGKDKTAQPMIRFKDDKIYIHADNIFIASQMDDETEPAVKGETLRKMLDDFMNAYNAHTHPTPTGPSGPPIPPDVTKIKKLQSNLEKIKQKK